MNDPSLSEARAVLGALPIAGTIQAIRRLGGLTNKVFRVDTDQGIYCLRLPGEGTQAYINRRNEGRAARETARVGVSPPVLQFDDSSGVCLTQFLDGATTMSPVAFSTRPGAPGRAGAVLALLHNSDARFANRFELFSMIDEYRTMLAGKGASVPEGYDETVSRAESARQALDAHPLPLAPCHCDPLSENFLDTGERMWLVDWEYSGMNDPLWDLGDLAVEAQMEPEAEQELLAGYFGREPSLAERGRVMIYKAMCDLLWTLWGLIQHANANPADDFWAYSLNRFTRCRVLMATPDFAESITAVARG